MKAARVNVPRKKLQFTPPICELCRIIVSARTVCQNENCPSAVLIIELKKAAQG